MNTPRDNWENLNYAVKSVRLSDEERSAGREKLASFMALTPRRVTAPAHARFFGRAASVTASATALALSLAGVSFAAESSLPGDALYPVKVSVNEEVRTALTTTDVGKAQWETERATRRLGEVEALAKKGALTEEARENLDVRFKVHAERAKQASEKLRKENNDEDADSSEAKLEGSVRAHGLIIEAIAEEKLRPTVTVTSTLADDDEARPESKKKERKKEARKEVIESVSKESTNGKSPKSSKKHDAIAASIATTRSALERAKSSAKADSFGAVHASLVLADRHLATGDALVTTDPKKAATAYRDAQRAVQEASTLLKASVTLRLRIDARKGDRMDESGRSKAGREDVEKGRSSDREREEE